MPFIDIYRFKLDSYNIRLKNIKFGELAKAEKGVILNNYSGDEPIINFDNIYTFDYLSGNRNFRNKYYNFYLNQHAKPNNKDVLIKLKYVNKEKIYLSKLVKNVLLKQKELPFMIENFDNLKTFNKSGYIKKVILDSREKLIIFGDNHGSFHTFYRNMLRLHLLGIVDMEHYTINPNYRILFLGDIVDRGIYALEILSILFEFMIRDTEYRLIINRGNHEEMDVNEAYGFKDEVKSKHSNSLWKRINDIFVSLPSAHILINPDTNTKIWCCHGFLPIQIDYFKSKLYEFIESDNVNLLLDETSSFQIRWNDPRIDGRDFSRGDSVYIVPHEITKSYLDIFDYIIRGHNDNYSNAFILKNDTIMDFTKLSDIISELKNPMFKFYLDDDINVSNIHTLEIQVNEPISTINIKQKNENFLNVLTISTNTDLGRNLDADSFILLRFDEDENNILPNSSMIKSMPIDITFINNYKRLDEFLTINEKEEYYKKIETESENDEFYDFSSEDTNYLVETLEAQFTSKFTEDDFLMVGELENKYRIKYLKYKNKYLKLKNL
ncbi:calcineurin-like phosphoesterase [Chlorella virus XW01]|nr:calcineurin-like phosphoesterase [Chlorella virus XW01]